MATITDIAGELNISTATVSRALNQSRLVTPELAARINETANKLGYKKRVIRRHRGRAILNIKLVLPLHEEPERALFYDLSSLIEGIQRGFKLCGINLLCETTSPKFQPYPHKKGGDLNGFIFAFNSPSPSTIKQLRAVGTPFVVLNRTIDGLPCVGSENAAGMEMIANHLKSARQDLKPAYLTLKGLGQINEERLEGFTATCEKQGTPFNSETDVYNFHDIPSITAEAIAPLAKKYNALVCANDIIGTVVLSELDSLGVSVPSQVSVTGFDDSPVRRLSRPLLTTVSMPLSEIARAAASRLEAQIIENKPAEENIRVAGTLMVAETT
ncbi:MAG: LacI family DNA-binding transcriptional regulator [Verrucomicrobia bacterium]|jgi:LacI family transcriptional regulator|nr:LacI family DNA-binding transcriptional regulator [Verrucomicrobiota bacterium]